MQRPASASYLRLGVNIDHVATIRNARGGVHPDPVRAALQAIAAGADGITAHLREDRRHIRDDDMVRLKAAIGATPLNFEMAATEQMLDIALKIKPHAACLVPEKRTERTTEGGLDVVGQLGHLVPFSAELGRAGIRVSLFIEPSTEAVEAAAKIRAPVVELHTGAWCDAVLANDAAKSAFEIARIRAAAAQTAKLGIECHAGHGLDFATARIAAAIPQILELNIGHFLVGEAVFTGLDAAIKKMRAAMDAGRATIGAPGMIIGIGNDAIDIRRIEATLEKFGERFLSRVFTPVERARSERRQGRMRVASYAKRFAAKEACSKALGTGLRKGVFWRDMGVVNLSSGRPTLALTGGAARHLENLTPAGMMARIDLTLTDDWPYAHAIVIISAIPTKEDPR